MSSWWRLLQALGLNAVPAGGFLLGSWSWDTALKLYWFENLLGGLFIGLRIALHRRWTGKRGHFRAHAFGAAPAYGQERPRRLPGSLLASFLVPTILFTAAHGLFLGFALRAILPAAEPGAAGAGVRLGALAIAGLLAAGFLFDLVSLRERTFRSLRELAEYHLERVVLVQLAILGGFVFMAWRGHQPSAFFLAFAGLKTMADVSALLARAAGIERVELGTPPPWFAGVMNRLGKKYRREEFLEYWQRRIEQDREVAAEDEQVERAGKRRPD